MRRVIHWTTIAAAFAIAWHVVGVAVPWWWALPDVPLAVSLARCPGAGVTLRSEAPILPVVLADSPDGVVGPESNAGLASCDRLVDAMRAEAPVLRVVWSGWLCRSVRAHVVDALSDAHLWAGPQVWVIDGRAVGGQEMFDALTARGIRYGVVDGRFAIAETP